MRRNACCFTGHRKFRPKTGNRSARHALKFKDYMQKKALILMLEPVLLSGTVAEPSWLISWRQVHCRDRISGSWFLPAGDYRMAVWGQCSRMECCRGGILQIVRIWDDFSFTGITLASSEAKPMRSILSNDSILVIVPMLNRWYPPAPLGTYVIYSFTLSQRSILNSLTMSRLYEWSIANGTRMYIRTA